MALAQRRLRDSLGQDRRMKDAYLFILGGRHHAASLAAKLGVSVPTASRVVDALKRELARRGKRLVSVRSGSGFHYEVRDDLRRRRIERDPLATRTIPARGARRPGLKREDRDLYDRD